jgi:hypothetical protein
MMSGVPTLESLMSTVHDDVAQQSAPIIESSSSDNVTLAASDVPATLAAATTTATPTAKSQGIWISHEELMSIPTSGAAWDALVKAANTPTGTPNLSNIDDTTDVYTLAKALVGERTGNQTLINQARKNIMAAIGTEAGGDSLGLSRNLNSYVIAADIVGLSATQDTQFRAWLRKALTENLSGRTLQSTHEDRANNWGTMAGATRAAVAAYLGDEAELARTAKVFKGWLGDRSSYASFKYGSDLSWQANPSKPVGINPTGATKNGINIDGALPEEMRRGGSFQKTPGETGYAWEALQGAFVQAEILNRAGYDTYQWQDQALLRSVKYLYNIGWKPTGDDAWLPSLINDRYGTNYATTASARPGKLMGWTAWTTQAKNTTPPTTTNTAPVVSAGTDQSVTLPSKVTLNGTVTDDGQPNNAVTTKWTKISGPGTVTFTDSTVIDTTASFSTAGSYVLRLSASDGSLSATDDVKITVANPTAKSQGIWISHEELMSIPTSGAAWDALVKAANTPTGTPNLSNIDDTTDVYTLAKALVGERTGNQTLINQARKNIMAAIGTEAGGDSLGLSRNLNSYVIAADIVGLSATQDTQFRAWLRKALTENLSGRTLQSTHEDRANNWGTMAGATRAAVAAYLGDEAELARTAKVFKGWLGDRSSYASFKYGSDLSWQANPSKPVGINPTGATKNGINIDGALPEEMRRGGSFQKTPGETGYAWEALQGAFVQAEILNRAGYDTYQWQDQALLRSVKYLYNIGWKPTGDDAWLPSLINDRYGTNYATTASARPGKLMGWTAWTTQAKNTAAAQSASADAVATEIPAAQIAEPTTPETSPPTEQTAPETDSSTPTTQANGRTTVRTLMADQVLTLLGQDSGHSRGTANPWQQRISAMEELFGLHLDESLLTRLASRWSR